MKATIKYRSFTSGKRKQITMSVTKDEPCSIIAEAIKTNSRKINLHPYDTVQTVRCGNREYQWHDLAAKALR